MTPEEIRRYISEFDPLNDSNEDFVEYLEELQHSKDTLKIKNEYVLKPSQLVSLLAIYFGSYDFANYIDIDFIDSDSDTILNDIGCGCCTKNEPNIVGVDSIHVYGLDFSILHGGLIQHIFRKFYHIDLRAVHYIIQERPRNSTE